MTAGAHAAGDAEPTLAPSPTEPEVPRLEIEVLSLGGSTVVKQSSIDQDAPDVELFRREANAGN